MPPPPEYSTLPEVVVAPRNDPKRDYRPPVPPKPSHFKRPSAPSSPDPPPEPQVPQPQSQVPTLCCECNGPNKAWKCVQCDDFFCDACWPLERPHRPGKVGIDGRQHEKVDEEVIHRLKQIFGQPTQEEQHRRHGTDINTTWFGVVKEANQPYLHYSNRLVDILRESQVGVHSDRFPQLVSFVGQTGAGKSTVIKMLIDREQARTGNTHNYAAPVPGLVGDNIPTTGDVHLYEDPGTHYAQKPILYADCEGMTGGENAPRGLACREMMESAKRPGKSMGKKLRKKLAWADNPKMQSREYAVRILFPRILYTFSDVVVFVLREVRTFQTDVLTQLVNWAAMSIDKSINQPSLPHIVIVLNATESQIDEKQWDTETATHGLLDDYRYSVHQVPALRDTLARLAALGKDITTTKQLLEYYYSSVTVVRIPAKGRYMQIDEQIGKLHDIIGRKCALSHAQKKKFRMLLNAEVLPQYVNAAYDHFSRRLDEPFDFVEEARRHTPLPQDFGGHILNLILSMYRNYDRRRGRVRDLFMKLSRPIASCIALAATRDNTQGTYSNLLRNTYLDPLLAALLEFCNHWLRCSFERDGAECRNVRNSHKKGHQAHTGRILARGHFESAFVADEFFPVWMDEIDRHIRNLDARLGHFDRDESATIPRIHIDVMADFYRTLDPNKPAASFRSNLTCLCCVRSIPENVLPCGHILCKACIQSYGINVGQGLFRLHYCPLHPRNTDWPEPAEIKFKPDEAGVRILCLDGGGIRAIVQLEILRAIEEALGRHIPIQNFFDLIVGTSTGGIVALGLGVKGWSVSYCKDQFKTICRQAFTPRGFKTLAMVSNKSYYKTKPLERALQSSFDDYSPLYGGTKHEKSTATRVAVTSTLASENRPVIFSNYNTEGERDTLPYKFLRPQDPAMELMIWEAARATAATAPYFKSFVQTETMAAYTDGAIHHNCPALVADYERRLLWKEVSSWPPDIFLSIGTGLSNPQVSPQSPGMFSLSPSEGSRPKGLPRQRNVAGLGYMWRAAPTDDQADCEEAWSQYHAMATVPNQTNRPLGEDSSVRINVEFEGERPELDKVEELENMERHAMNMMRDNPRIYEVARKLVASCFYFEKAGAHTQYGDTGEYICSGDIRCRFDEGSTNLIGLGHILRKYILGNTFVPFFLLEENYGSLSQRKHQVPIPVQTINSMCYSGCFQLPTIRIAAEFQFSVTCLSLCLQPESYRHNEKRPSIQEHTRRLFSISGFPRKLITQDNLPLHHVEDESESEGEGPVELPVPDTAPSSPGVQRSWGTRLFKSPSLYKTLSQRAATPKPKSPGGMTTDIYSSRDANSVDLSSQASSSRLATSSGESRSSAETANGRLESDSASRDETDYSRYRWA
ncbi:hypothetical protein EDB80DRAFT_838977 [Ilyonectria destructans]|nr:hypothetical protein EDB80DRAFT_838977 [Ilyonectria destructans]